MSLGVHFALTPSEADRLRSFEDDADRLEYLQEDIEEEYLSNQREFHVQTDKAWDAMHRLLSGTGLYYQEGAYPLRLAVLGGEPVYDGDDYIMVLKTPSEVQEVSVALRSITENTARVAYNSIDEADYGMELSEEDFGYTWENLIDVIAFFQTAASAGRYVLFTADQ